MPELYAAVVGSGGCRENFEDNNRVRDRIKLSVWSELGFAADHDEVWIKVGVIRLHQHPSVRANRAA